MTNKMTNRKALAYVLENVNTLPADVREKLATMAAALENKATATKRKPTKTQQENENLRQQIMAFLTDHPTLMVTCTDLGKQVPALNGLNNQKISSLMKVLVEYGQVTKVVEKGKSIFQLAKDDAEVEDEQEDGDEG